MKITNADQGCMEVVQPSGVTNETGAIAYSVNLAGSPYALNIVAINY